MVFHIFPVYFTGVQALRSVEEYAYGNPFWVLEPTLDHFRKLFFATSYPKWMWNTVIISVTATFVSLAASVFAARNEKRPLVARRGRS